MTELRHDFADQTSEAHELARSRQMLTVEDVDAIGGLVERIPTTDYLIAVDLGAGSGTTALAALCARREAVGDGELQMRIFSFDVDQEMLDWTQQAVKNAGFEGYWRGFQMAAFNGARHWEDAHRTEIPDELVEGLKVDRPSWVGVDLLLHDAGHGRGDVYADIAAWLPKLVPGGLVWVHDYAPAPEDWAVVESAGVKVAVERLIEDGLLVEGGGEVGMGWTGMKPGEDEDDDGE